MKVKYLEDKDRNAWNEFVMRHQPATFFHLAEWKDVVEEAFGHKTYYLYAVDNGGIRGILPLAHVKSFLFGNSLCSLPFCVYGGVVAETAEAEQFLISRAEELARSLGVGHLELRDMSSKSDDSPEKELYVTFRKEIDPDPDVNMKNIPRKQRAMVRKGVNNALVTEIEDDVEIFYSIYALSVRDHGTPTFGKNFFRILKEKFKDQCEIRVVLKDSEPLSTVMSFYFRDEVLPYYGGGTPGARKYKAFDFMYWDLMKSACGKGIRIFDFGRSKIGTGSYSFKKNWGFIPEHLHYHYHLINRESAPDINPLNPKYQLFIRAWKKLPLGVAEILGPHLSKGLG